MILNYIYGDKTLYGVCEIQCVYKKTGKKDELIYLGSFRFRTRYIHLLRRFLLSILHSTDKVLIIISSAPYNSVSSHCTKHDKECCKTSFLSSEKTYASFLNYEEKDVWCLYCGGEHTKHGMSWCEHAFIESLVSSKWFSMGHYYISFPKEDGCFSAVLNIKRKAIHFLLFKKEFGRVNFVINNTTVDTNQGYFSHTRKANKKQFEAFVYMINNSYINTPVSLFSYCFKSFWDNEIKKLPNTPLFNEYKEISGFLQYFQNIFW